MAAGVQLDRTANQVGKAPPANFLNMPARDFQHSREEAVLDQVEPAAVQVDFLPEERAFSKVIQQIKQRV